MKTAIITDSSAYLSPSDISHPDLTIIPIPIIVDEKIYNEGLDLDETNYTAVLNQAQTFPKTSQPVIGEVLLKMENLRALGYTDVVVITLSSGISGYFNTLYTLKEEVPGLTIWPFDSKITSVPMGAMVQRALSLVDLQTSPQNIIETLSEMRENTRAFMIVDDLQHLVRGGRLNNGAAIIGGLLKIKPVLTFEEGHIVVAEKIRTSKKAFLRTRELLSQEWEHHPEYRYFIIHANNLAQAKEEQQQLLSKHPQMDLEIAYFSPVIGLHLGDQSLGFGWVKK